MARRCPPWTHGAGFWWLLKLCRRVAPPVLCQRLLAQRNSCLSDFSSLLPKLLMSLLQFPKQSARKSKKKKGVFWGIEVAETLRWHGWELGKEMIKHLILKNVHEKTQRLSYRCVGSFFLLHTPHMFTASSSLLLDQSH